MSNTENSTITADQNTAGTVNSQRPKDCRTKINVRKGHRSWATRTINNANDALIHFSDDMRVDLDGWKLVLTDKLGVLEKYDEEIMSYMSDEDEIEKEIFDSSQVRGDMQKMILRIETKLGTSCCVNHATVSTSSRTPRSAKMPKLTLKSFGGKRQNAPPQQFDGEESHDLEKPSTGSTLLTGAGQDDRRVTCTYCRRNHVSSKCDVITDVNVRRAILMKKARCFVCLKPSHRARDCQSTNKCFKCQGRHHISLCDPQRTNDRQNLNKERDPQTNLITVAKSSSTLLQTAQAEIFSKSSGRRETV